MRALVNFKQPLAIDAGINLGGRQRSVAEQFLDRRQIAAARQQMGGEGMTQRVRGCAIRQTECAAQSRHGELNDAGLQRSAAGAQIQGARSSPARSSASATRLAAATAKGFGRLLPIFGARIADSAPTLPRPSRSRKRPNERSPASARISERLAISSVRRLAMKG